MQTVFLRGHHTIKLLELDFAALFINNSPQHKGLGFSLVGWDVFIVLCGLFARVMKDKSDAVSIALRRCAHNVGYLKRAC